MRNSYLNLLFDAKVAEKQQTTNKAKKRKGREKKKDLTVAYLPGGAIELPILLFR